MKEFLHTNQVKSSVHDTAYTVEFRVSNDRKVIQRSRYSFWQALGDIGGFHDGLCLIIGLLLEPLSATLFKKDLVKDSVREEKHTADQRRNRRQLAELLSFNYARELSDPQTLTRSWTAMFDIKWQPVQADLKQTLIAFFCRCFNKHSKRGVLEKFVKRKTTYLDVRKIIKNHISL